MIPVPPSDAGPRPSAPAPLDSGRLVEWKGQLPAEFASFLDRLCPAERRNLKGVVCRFREVREIVNIARCVGQVLDDGPRAAFVGCWSFEEFVNAKTTLGRLINQLHSFAGASAMYTRNFNSTVSSQGEIGHAVA